MEQEQNSIPGKGLGKEIYRIEDDHTPSPDEKGASDVDIKQRDAGITSPETSEKKEKTAPSGDMIVNTGADIGSKGADKDADAASG